MEKKNTDIRKPRRTAATRRGEESRTTETLPKTFLESDDERAKTDAIIEALGDAISIQDTDFRIILQNRLHRDLLGSHVGEYCYKAYQRKDGVCEGCHLAMTFRDGKIHKEEQKRFTENGVLYYEITASPLKDVSGRIVAGIEAVRDITERKKIEDALRESEDQYRDLFENASDIIQILSPEGHFLFVNRAWREALGYREDEISALTVFDIIADDQRDHCSRTFAQAASEGKVDGIETVFMAKGGRRILVEGSANCRIKDGKVFSVRCMFRDVTEKKKMEGELLKVQKLESLGILAGGIAHDFNNIMTAILGNISLALMQMNPQSPLYERLREAEKATTRAKDLTRQLLTFAKGGDPVKKTVFLGDLIQETVSFALRGTNVKSVISLPGDLKPVEVDEGQMSQVINNLIINAVQAMPEGGVVTVSAENVAVGHDAPSPLTSGEYVKVTIGDTGIGIAESHLRKIFDPFFTTKQRGSGLGLAVTYSIVKRHDGHITAESLLGKGTKFHVYLPVSRRRVVEIGTVEDTHVSGRGRVLIMDDDELVREVACAILGRLGYDAESSADGEEAIAVYRMAKDSGRPFDAVVMDLTVPGGMGGREAIERLRAIDPEVRAIVSSGYSNDPVMSHFAEYGFKGMLAKPYQIAELSRTLHEVIAED